MLQWNSKYSAVLVISLLVAIAMFIGNFTWHGINFTW
jgi:hypothetical protein